MRRPPPPLVHTGRKKVHLKTMPLVELQTIKENHKKYTNYKTTEDSSESFENKQLFRGYRAQKPKLKPNKLSLFVSKIL